MAQFSRLNAGLNREELVKVQRHSSDMLEVLTLRSEVRAKKEEGREEAGSQGDILRGQLGETWPEDNQDQATQKGSRHWQWEPRNQGATSALTPNRRE